MLYYLCLENAIHVQVRVLSLITTDTAAVSTETEMCAFLKKRRKWNGEIKHYRYMSIVYNSRHINSGISKSLY